MLYAQNSVNTGQNKSFTYNLLNLPKVVTIPTGTITYTYDAAGKKLRKVSVINGVTRATDYIDGIEYDNSTTNIGFIQTEEGKAVPYGTNHYDYTYYLGDNLGNSRVTFDTETGHARSVQTDDYYPFGMEINHTVANPKNEYLYNKKELQEELGQYDYGARFYDPVIAKWTTVDPLAEVNRRWSQYNYVVDNPIRFIDPDGMTQQTHEEIEQTEQRWAGEKMGFLAAANPAQQSGSGYENGAGVNNNNNNTDNQCCKTPSQDHTASSNNSEAIKNHENKIKSANQGGEGPDYFDLANKSNAVFGFAVTGADVARIGGVIRVGEKTITGLGIAGGITGNWFGHLWGI